MRLSVRLSTRKHNPEPMPHAAAAHHSDFSTTGKTAAQENFPVGSWLLPAPLRPQIAAYYRFARHADDVADSTILSPEDKVMRLDALDRALLGQAGGPETRLASELRQILVLKGISIDHARNLLEAFKRDAMCSDCSSWSDLMAYCRFSAAPVGRFLLDLHGESDAAHHPSDCLCAALQIINHLQDCKGDYLTLRRVYVPVTWLMEEGLSVAALADDQASPELREVLDRVLDGTDGLLDQARVLPSLIRNRRMRMEAAVILDIARTLAARLRREDPLAKQIRLSARGTALCFLRGMIRGWSAR